jgi:hypothetical protein
MSDTIKQVVPYVRYTKWTGDNLTELQTYWEPELTHRGMSLSADSETGELVSSAPGLFSPFGSTIPEGAWFTIPRLGMYEDDEQFFAAYTEVVVP